MEMTPTQYLQQGDKNSEAGMSSVLARQDLGKSY